MEHLIWIIALATEKFNENFQIFSALRTIWYQFFLEEYLNVDHCILIAQNGFYSEKLKICYFQMVSSEECYRFEKSVFLVTMYSSRWFAAVMLLLNSPFGKNSISTASSMTSISKVHCDLDDNSFPNVLEIMVVCFSKSVSKNLIFPLSSAFKLNSK